MNFILAVLGECCACTPINFDHSEVRPLGRVGADLGGRYFLASSNLIGRLLFPCTYFKYCLAPPRFLV